MSTPKNPGSTDDSGSPDPTADLVREQGQSHFSGDNPTKIGPYVIKRVIASGGMGTVYEAMQENPRRPAAVKVIKRSMASQDALRRFEREAQALARLRHPGIAQIYEAGTFVEAGVSLPFFALEYIPNAKTIIEFTKSMDYGVRQKLELFLQVCEAVHYGHQRGIIHRDLKPGNILVDSEARVRIIDFGVARAIDADLEQADNQTRVGQIIGTPQYMSPEQFEADPNDLDTRSDVYALGVVLYELVSGRLPYDIEHSGVFEVARTVREEQPVALNSAVPGVGSEVGLITAKALHKNREARYQSAFGFAEDLRRYLKGEAISARPTSLAYQVKVLARKNKAAVGLATLAVVFLVVGIITTTALFLDVRTERAKADIAAQQALSANAFLTNTLSAVVPYGFGDAKTIGDLCDLASRDIDDAFPGNPTTEADVRNTIGRIYSRIDQRPQAELQLRKAHSLRSDNLGPSHELTLEALSDLNFFYYVYGPSTRNVETSELYLSVVSGTHAHDHELTIQARESLIEAYVVAERFTDAEQLMLENQQIVARQFGTESVENIVALRGHALLTLMIGNLTSAKSSAKEALELANRLLGEKSPEARDARNVYASTLVTAGELAEAKNLYGHLRPPEPVGIELEYQGTLGNLDEAVKLLVFFETWCPFSQKYIPKIESLSNQYRGLGVDVLGLTRTDRSSSDDQVRQFILDNHLSFSVLKENGRSWNYFDATGTPFTVVLHEGEVIWESPGTHGIFNQMLEGIVNAD